MARARGIKREGTLAVFPREREKTTGKKTGGRVEEMVVAVSVGCVGGKREKKGKSSETERRKGAKPEVNSRKKEKKQFEKKNREEERQERIQCQALEDWNSIPGRQHVVGQRA